MKVIDCLFYFIVIGLNSQVNAQNITPKKLPNIVYIFSSDNGPWLVMEALGGSAGHLREGKNYTFEGFEGYAGSPWKQAVAAHDTLLFDLRTDPGETRNLYPENRDLGKRLLEEMKQQYQNLGPFPPSLVVRTASDNSHFEILAARRQKIDQPDQGYIEVDGSKLKYVVEGEGTPCLVIGSSIYYPKTFSADLRKNLKMYFVDLKWFAEDYKPENLDSVNIASIVQDVEEIRAKLGLEKPILMGHSIHGTIAMEYVKEHPDQVRGLVLIGSPAEWGNATYEKKAAALWQTASSERKALQEQNWGKVKELDRLTGQEEASARYNNMSPQYWYNPTYDAGWLWDGMTVHSEVTQHLFSKVFLNYNMFQPAVTIPVPVFVGLGKYDYVIPYTLWEPAYESIPDFTIKYFEKSGHTPQLEEPDKFNQALRDWLSALSK